MLKKKIYNIIDKSKINIGEPSHVEAAFENFVKHYGRPTMKNLHEFFGLNLKCNPRTPIREIIRKVRTK